MGELEEASEDDEGECAAYDPGDSREEKEFNVVPRVRRTCGLNACGDIIDTGFDSIDGGFDSCDAVVHDSCGRIALRGKFRFWLHGGGGGESVEVGELLLVLGCRWLSGGTRSVTVLLGRKMEDEKLNEAVLICANLYSSHEMVLVAFFQKKLETMIEVKRMEAILRGF